MHCALCITIASCGQRPVYSHYEHLSSDGWLRDSVLTFTTTVADSARYALTMGLRATNDYPYTQLTVTTRCQTCRSAIDRTDTVTIDITDDEGNILGKGTTIFSYDMPLTPVLLLADDTLTVTVTHAMRRPLLPGITDVGITAEAMMTE